MRGANDVSRVRLRDGRSLAWAEYGDPRGKPVLYFHGFPGSRLEPALAGDSLARTGARLIAIDRPGFGGSTFQPGRRLLDWPNDVASFADSLGLDHFACMGVSGGGPYVLACALRLEKRLTRAAVVCGVGPLDTPEGSRGMMRSNRLLFGAARHSKTAVRLITALMARSLRRDPSAALLRMTRSAPELDRAVLERPEAREAFALSSVESLRPGTRGAGLEAQLYARPWGFRLEDVTREIELYQGELDVNVAPSMGRYQASALPHCKAHFFPDEGHFSPAVNYMEEIVRRLVS